MEMNGKQIAILAVIMVAVLCTGIVFTGREAGKSYSQAQERKATIAESQQDCAIPNSDMVITQGDTTYHCKQIAR